MNKKRVGRRTIALSHPPSVHSFAAVGGKMESDGPLAPYFDELCRDSFFGEKTWEKAESAMQKRALGRALEKGGLNPGDLDYVLGGDLLNQCIGSAFGLRDFGIPYYGLYGACSTMGESLSLAAMLIDGGYAEKAAAITSSHFCTAERQYRMPVPYGSQRTPTAQWTATASGCTILAAEGDGPYITHVTCGKIVDKGIKDGNNMGAAMAPEDVKLAPCVTHIRCAALLSTPDQSRQPSSIRRSMRAVGLSSCCLLSAVNLSVICSSGCLPKAFCSRMISGQGAQIPAFPSGQ